MIEQRWGRAGADGRCRRAHEVLDDYDRGGVLSEQLADELCNELAGLGPRTRPGRQRRASVPCQGPQPSRPAPPRQGSTSAGSARPRLTLVRDS